jgi:predicted dehydrogenase
MIAAGDSSCKGPQATNSENGSEKVPSDRRSFMAQAAGAALALPLVSARAREMSSSRSRRIRVGQIGTAHGHANKLAVFRQSADYEVIGIAESDPELRAAAESQDAFRGVPWFTQEQLLNLPGLELVLVETQVPKLLDAAEACVAAGKHVHLDKPAGRSLPQFRRILDEAARKKLLVQMGYMFRYNPAVVLLREFLHNGWLGQPFELHAVMSKVVSQVDRKPLVESGGSMMFELGCHLIDLVVSLLGKPGDVAPFGQHVSPIQDSLIDNALAVLTCKQAIATVKSSAVEIDGGQRRHLVLCGSEGTFHIQPLDDPSARVTLSKACGKYRQGSQEITFPKYTRYVDDAADIAKILRGEKESDYSAQHDLDVQETVLRACGWSLS